MSSHTPEVQRKGEQSTSWGSRQVPWPSQVGGAFSSNPEQDDKPHGVSRDQSEHEPKPSHRPVVPQVLWSLALQSGSGRPAGMNVQWPPDPVWLHDTQAPAHSTLQHTLSAQKPEAQSSAVSQTAPLALLPQRPFTHSCCPAHSALVVHMKAHRLVFWSQV
jgi:hypothetical protein